MGGRAKCLLRVQGHSLLERLVHAVRSLGQNTPVLVLGHHAHEIQAHLAQWPTHLTPSYVVNPAPEDDPASSLHIGLRALAGNVQTVVVLLADQPLINAADIEAVLDAFQRRPADCHVMRPVVSDVPGHPVVFDASVRDHVMTSPGHGLRSWRAAHPMSTLPWVVDNSNYTRDLDTPEDLETLERETGWVCRWPGLDP